MPRGPWVKPWAASTSPGSEPARAAARRALPADSPTGDKCLQTPPTGPLSPTSRAGCRIPAPTGRTACRCVLSTLSTLTGALHTRLCRESFLRQVMPVSGNNGHETSFRLTHTLQRLCRWQSRPLTSQPTPASRPRCGSAGGPRTCTSQPAEEKTALPGTRTRRRPENRTRLRPAERGGLRGRRSGADLRRGAADPLPPATASALPSQSGAGDRPSGRGHRGAETLVTPHAPQPCETAGHGDSPEADTSPRCPGKAPRYSFLRQKSNGPTCVRRLAVVGAKGLSGVRGKRERSGGLPAAAA